MPYITIVYTFTNILTGCENQDTRTIQVVPLPTVVVDDTINFCINNNNITLSAYVNWNPAGGSWSGPGVVDPTNGLFNATIAGGLATGGADTSFTLTYTYTDNNGCGNSDILLVNLTFGDTVEAGPNDTLCLDDNPILLTGFSPAGGTWTGNGVDPLGTFDPLAAGVGTHTLTYTFGTGTCLKADTRQIVVGAPPTINIGPDQTVCIDGAAFTLIGYSPQGGTWSGVGITDSIAGIFDPLVAGVGSHILTYTFGNSITGCESSAMRTITVAPLPTVFAGDSVTYCDNPNDITLTGYSPAGGTWSGAGIVDPAQGLFNTVIAGGVGVYPLVYCFTDGNGCNSCDTLIVDVIFGDSVEAGPNLAVCISDGLITFSGFQPANGIWSGPGIIDPVGVFDPQVAGAGAHTVYVNTVDTGTCLKIDSRIIFVGTPPIVNPGADETVCISESAYALAGYSPPGGIWTGIGITDTTAGVFDPQVAGIGQHVLLYTVTNSVTNCISTATKVVDVVPLPFVDAGDTVTYCDNPDNIVLDAPIPTTGGIWSGSGILNPSNGIFNTQNAGGLGVGGADTSYTLTYTFTDQNGCTNADSLLVDIIFGDTVEAGPDDTVCINELPFILQGSPSGGSWSGNGVTGGGLFDPSLAGSGLHTVTYTFGTGSCQKTDNKTIFVALPVPVDAGVPLKICIDAQPITLNGFTPVGGIWTGAGIIDPSGVFDPAVVGLGLHTITYTYTDSETGCISFDQTTVEVVPLPVVSAGGSVTYCEVNYEVTLPTPSPVGGSWFGPGITNNTLGLFNPTAAGGIGTYQILYTFTDGNGCANSDVLTVDIIFGDTINAGPDRIACVDGDTITLTGFSPVGGTWSGMGIIDPAGLFLPSAAGAGSHNLVYTQGVGTCEKTDTIIIAVVDVTTATAGPDVEFCFEDGLVTLTGQNPTGGVWSGPGIIDGNLGTFLTQAVGIDTQTVSVVVDYTYTDAFSGCAFTDDKMVTINPLPTIDFTTVDTACSGTTVNFTNLSEDAISYVWHFGDGDTSIFLNPTHTYDTAGIYTVTLIGLSDESCPDTITKDIVIFDIPQANFVMSADTGCGPLVVTFTDNSIGQQMDYFWDFGNGQTSTLANPGQIGFAAGTFDTTYVISLTVTNQCGATTYTDSVEVFPTPNVIFAPNNAQGCTPLTVTFSNATTGNATSYLWDFGDGTFSTDSIPPPHVFYTINDSLTQYTVTLTASNHCGTDVGSVVITVEPGSLNAGFNANVTSGCQPLTVDFTSITQPGDNVSWAFGYNGEVSALLNPVHTFDTAGTFTVYQYVNNNCGFDTASIDITVYPAPPIEFNHQAFVCVGQDMQFFNTSDSISGNLWQFGDGDTSTSINPFHSYDQVGFYEVILTNYSITNLCPITDTTIVEVKPNPVANFSPDVFQGCAPLTVNFSNTSTGLFSSWDFGDGNVSINSNPTYTYNDDGQYSVTLTTTDNFGCFSDTTISGIVAYPTPVADFETSTSVQCGVDAMVTMINTSQDADAYFWDFGNQQISNLTNPTISYNNIGDHTITLIANNTFGCADTTQELFTTHPGPIADYGLEPQAGCSPHTVQFIQFAANANSYYWYFGDGDTSRDANPIHTYTEEGFYDVTFIASLDDECFDTLTINSVVDVQGSPTADFEAVEPDPNNPTGVLQMINNSVGAVSYVWDFGDGTTSQLPNPRHEYLENGPVTIELIAFSANGCSDTMRQVITPPFFKGLFVPNAFSPDAGIGDVRVWRPVGVSLGDYKAQIFTPWGELLWESTALDDAGRPSESWDGTNPNGDPMPQGAYVWKIFAVFADGSQWKGQQNTLGQTKKIGSVTLLR